MTLSTISVVAVAIALLGYLCYRAALPRPLPGIPYNKKSASRILGDGPDFLKYQADYGEKFAYMAKLASGMKEPVIQIFMQPFGKPWVIINDPRESNDIMTRRVRDFDRSRFIGQVFEAIAPKHHISLPTADEWHAHRRLIADTMSPAFLHEIAGPQMRSSALSMVNLWREKARLAVGRPFEASTDIHNTTLDIIWAATFGGDIGPNKALTKRLAAIENLDSNIDNGSIQFPTMENSPAFNALITLVESMAIPVNSMFPGLAHWFALSTRRDLIVARKEKDNLIRSKLQEAERKLAEKPKTDTETTTRLKSALDMVVSKEIKIAEKEGRATNVTSQAIQDELFGFLIAGQDTTSTTFCWAIKFLTRDPKTQAKLRDVLRSSFKRAAESNETPAIEEITGNTVPYLDAVAEESTRISIITIATMRKSIRDTDVLGYRIPKDTDVFLMNNGPGSVMAHAPVDEAKRSQTSKDNKDKVPDWGDDLGEFRPERWLDGEGRFNPNAGPNGAFGAGPRGCFGRKWAHLELKILIVCLFWNFELLPTPPELSSMTATNGLTRVPNQCFARLKALAY